jgi:protein-tyrosine phosphatase
VDLRVYCAPERFGDQPRGPQVLYCNLSDDPSYPWLSDPLFCDVVVFTGEPVARWVRAGLTARVSCRVGWNRSGLIVCIALRKLGLTVAEAIDRVRRARGPRAMSNPRFVEALRSYEP